MPDSPTLPPLGGDLPRWTLEDLYSHSDSPEIEHDLSAAASEADAFRNEYQGRLAPLLAGDLTAAIDRYAALQERLGRLMSYGQLLRTTHLTDARIAQFCQTLQERVTEISSGLIFFTHELNALADAELEMKMQTPPLARYAPWLRDVRLFRPHQLSIEMEQFQHEQSVAGRSAWIRLFDETLARLRFPLKNKDLTLAEITHLFSDQSPDLRREAGLSVGQVLTGHGQVFSLITNVLAKDKAIEDKWRRFEKPISARNLENRVEEEVVTALVETVKSAWPKISHRYYALKAKWLGMERLNSWDRNAPLPSDQDASISWEQGKQIVLDAYQRFSPCLRELAEPFFEKGWIDAEPRAGKDAGAFAHPAIPSLHPYILLNYMGKKRDVMTLAHELGHGVHMRLSARQGVLLADPPLTLAETASVFGEMLTFRSLLDQEAEPNARRALLAAKVEDMLNTVSRQIAFHEFERQLHDRRRQGELAPEEICGLWMDTQTASLGPAFRFGDHYAYYWAYIPHFIHSPFYVYAYAFADCLVNSLYARYLEGDPAFVEKYFEMLSQGGRLRHRELLRPFGLDAADPGFWQQGISVIAGLIDQLEALEEPRKV